jgi:hypothetical protein
MTCRLASAFAASALCSLAAVPAPAATVGYASDAAFLASAGFVSSGGANARWGNDGTSGDWEYAVVDGADMPLSQGQLQWSDLAGYAAGSPTVANHGFTFTYAVSGALTFALRDVNGVEVGSDTDPATPGTQRVAAGVIAPPLGGINTLVIRARAAAGDVAVVGPGGAAAGLRVSFAGGGFFDLDRLVGDADAEYLLLRDERLGGGFSITDNAALRDGAGSLPMWQFKVGVTPVPEPAALPLAVGGLALLGLLARRR